MLPLSIIQNALFVNKQIVGVYLQYVACIPQEDPVPVLECIDLGSDSEDEGFLSSLTGTVSS